MNRIPFRAAAIAAGVSLLLAACGGSGDDGASAPVSPSALSVNGTAATGAALASATVSATCATGTGTATTAADGSYTVSVAGGVLPCVLTATSGSIVLHSVITSGTTAQITPLTELLIAQLTGADPTTLSPVDISSLFTADNVSAAQTKVLAILSGAGVDTTALSSTSLLTGTLTAASGSTSGNSYDVILDNLGAALSTAGITLETLTATVVTQATDPGSSSSTDTSTSALAPELLLREKSPTCDSLRSGSYWMINTAHTGDAWSSDTGVPKILHSVDAKAGTITQVSDGTLYTLTAVDGDACHYTAVADDQSTGEVVVSPAGVIVARGNDSQILLVGIPRQTHTLDEMAGNWDWVGIDTYDDTNTSWVYDYGQIAVTGGTSGTTLQIQRGCAQTIAGSAEEACISTPDAMHTLASDSDGGFLNSPVSNVDGVWTDKMYAYHAGNGTWFMVSATCNISALSTCVNGTTDGSIGFATRTRTLSLPTVDSVSDSWNIYLDTATQLSTTASDTSRTTVTAIDASTGSFTRTAGTIGGATHLETLLINNPYDGFNFRSLATSVTTSDDSTTTVRKTYMMKTGVGVSVNVQPITTASKTARVVLSVGKPAS